MKKVSFFAGTVPAFTLFFIFISGFMFTVGTPAFSQEQTVWLDEMDLTPTTCGWKQTRAKLTVDGNPLQIEGRKFERGVGHHAPGDIVISLPEKCGIRFLAEVGIDDEVGTAGHAEFLIYGGARILWRSGPMTGKDPAKSVSLELAGFEKIRLHCDTLPEGYGHDHQDWADARILYAGEKIPHVIRASEGLYDENGEEISRMDENACEWLSLTRQLQTGMRENVRAEALDPASTLFESDRDPLDVVVRRIAPMLAAMEEINGKQSKISDENPDRNPDGKLDENLNENRNFDAEKAELASYLASAKEIPTEDIARRKALFAQVTDLRRRAVLWNPLLNFKDILFIKRHYNPEPEKEGNHMCDQFFGFHGRPGGGLFVLKNAFSEHPETVNVLENVTVKDGRNKGRKLDSTWAFLAPELSYDGTEILFCAADTSQPRHTYTWTEENCYHIFKAKFDPASGRAMELIQLTDGPYDDIDPCFLPSGRIVFISERRGGFGRCHGRPVPSYTLHSMNADGSDIVMLSPHETNEWQPDVDANGMILYTRWDYVDRGFNQAHHPWITTPDGCDPRVIQGNYDRIQSDRPHFEADIHPVPGSTKLTATATGHHAQAYGSLVLIDTKIPDGNQPGQIRRITPDQLFPESECATHRDPANYGTCWPLSEHFYLCIYDAFSKSSAGPANNYGIYFLDAFGNRTLLYRDAEISCRDAMPLRTRPRPMVVPHRTLLGKPLEPGEKFQPLNPESIPKTATVGLINVYDSMFPFPAQKDGTPARIERLRIVQLLPKTNPYAHNPAIGYGDQKGARRILGTVPVESDGSAFFSLPVNVPVYFQALGADGVAVQTMRSATYVHPGEQLTCQGCHENRHSGMANRPSGMPQAMRRTPSEITPDPDGTNPFSYTRLIQPVLDAKCTACHSGSDTNFGNAADRGSENMENIPISEEAKLRAASLDLRSGDRQKQHFFTSFETLRKYCFYYDNASWTEPQTFPGKFGSNRSALYETLRNPHFGVHLTPEELYRFTVWMDNNCDFYGSYDDCPLQRTGAVVEPQLE